MSPAADVAWAFELDGTLVVGAGASVRLDGGVLVARIARTQVDVAVGGLHALTVDALFSLSRTAAEVVVEVAEGTVELVDASFARRQVKAPQRLRLADGVPLSEAVLETPRGVRLSPLPGRPWTQLDASGLASGTRLFLDGALVGEAPMSMLVESGRHRLGVAAPGEAVHESWVELSGRHVVKPASAMVERPAVASDEAALELIRREVTRQRPKLKACYEKWLKGNPTASEEVEVELELLVSASGRVKRATVAGLTGEPADCLVRAAKALSLPRLGVEVELQLPLKLTTQRE
jgi:hypothetical protein